MDSSEKPQPRRRRRWFLIGLLAFFFLVTIGMLLYREYENNRGREMLRQALAESDQLDPGWRWADIEARRPRMPDAQNGMLKIQELARLGSSTRLLKPGTDQYLENSEFANRLRPLDELQAIETWLKENNKRLTIARQLKDCPYGYQFLQIKDDPFATLLPFTQECREASFLLSNEVEYLAVLNEPEQAMERMIALLNASRALTDEPFFISQLVRIAIQAVSVGRLERLLALTEPSTQGLEVLARMLEEIEQEPLMLYAARGERALGQILFENWGKGTLPINLLMITGTKASFSEQIESFLIRMKLKQNHANYLRYMNQVVEIAKLPIEQQEQAEKNLKLPPPGSESRLIYLLAPAIEKVFEANRRSKAQIRCARALIVVEQYRQQNGHWPKDLAEIPNSLWKGVPLDPYDGQPLRYKKFSDSVAIYSIGLNKQDDGGRKLDQYRSNEPGDVGLRLWNPEFRRQPPPPREIPSYPVIAALDAVVGASVRIVNPYTEQLGVFIQDDFEP